MEGSAKRKRSDDVSEERLFKKFEVLESRLMDLWATDSNNEESTLDPLNAGVTGIVSLVNGQAVQNDDSDEGEERYDEDEDQYSEEDNFNAEKSFIEEVPREDRLIEEIFLSDEETTNTWEDPTGPEDDTQSNENDHDVILVNEQTPKPNEFSSNSYSNEVRLHPDITETWTVWTRSGVPFLDKQELLHKYAPPKFLRPPEINQEIRVTLHKRPIEKDELIRTSQEILGSALTALGSTMSALITDSDMSDKLKVLNSLNDTAKLLTELFHFDTEKRRSNVISWKPQPVQALLVGTKPDDFMFGKNLNAKISEAQRSGKMGDLKPYVFKKNNNRPYKYFPSPYHWFGSKEEEEKEEQNFVLNPLKQEPQEKKLFCKKEEEECPIKVE